MKKWVIDASVATKWFLQDADNEPDTDHALRLLELGLEEQAQFLQPSHWVSEIAAVLARRAPTTAVDNIRDLQQFDFCTVISSTPIYLRAIKLAQALDHHLFDTLYHALALEEKALMITADAKYFRKASHLGGITLLKDLPV